MVVKGDLVPTVTITLLTPIHLQASYIVTTVPFTILHLHDLLLQRQNWNTRTTTFPTLHT